MDMNAVDLGVNLFVGLGEATNGFINLAASAPYGDGGH